MKIYLQLDTRHISWKSLTKIRNYVGIKSWEFSAHKEGRAFARIQRNLATKYKWAASAVRRINERKRENKAKMESRRRENCWKSRREKRQRDRESERRKRRRENNGKSFSDLRKCWSSAFEKYCYLDNCFSFLLNHKLYIITLECIWWKFIRFR